MGKKPKKAAGNANGRPDIISKETRRGKPSVNTRSFLHLCFLITLGVLPFIISLKLIDPVSTPRYLALSILIILVCLFFWIKSRDFQPKAITTHLKWIFLLAIIYGAWSAFGLFGAVNKQEVMFGLSRHFSNLIVLFLVYYLVCVSDTFIKDIARLLSVTAILHGFIGILQFYDAGFNNIPGNYPPYGLMANRNLFGSAQVLLIPFVGYTCWSGTRRWRLIGATGMVFILSSAIISQTRSAWLAAIMIIIAALILAVSFMRTERKKWMIAGSAVLGISVLLVLFFVITDNRGELGTELKQRIALTGGSDSLAVQSEAAVNVRERIKIWKKTGELIKDNLLVGVGLNNWKLSVSKYGSEGLNWENGLHSPDQPHNDFLLVAAESGLPGLIFFAGFWILVLISGVRTIRLNSDHNTRVILILMIAGILGFLTDAFFSFPLNRIEHSLYIFLMAGVVIGLHSKTLQTTNIVIPKSLKIAITVFGLFNLILAIKRLTFEKHFSLAKSYEYVGNFPESLNEAIKGKSSWVSIGPNVTPIEVYSGLGYLRAKNYPQALREFNQGIRYHPYLKVLYINKGTVYTSMGQYDSAIIQFKKALELTPKMDIISYNLAANYFMKKDYKSALEILNNVDISKQPRLVEMKSQAEQFLADPAGQ